MLRRSLKRTKIKTRSKRRLRRNLMVRRLLLIKMKKYLKYHQRRKNKRESMMTKVAFTRSVLEAELKMN